MPATELTADDLTDGQIGLLTLLVKAKLCPSISEARRLVQQGGVSVDDVKVSDIGAVFTAEQLKDGILVKRGKKNFQKVILK